MRKINILLSSRATILQLFCSLVLLIILGVSFSATLPKGCEHIGYELNDPFLVLNQAGNQTFYLIENTTNDKIELQKHETEDVFMSPPLIAIIEKGKWAAFASDVRNLHFQCFVHEKFDIIRVNCKDVVQVCQYPRVKFALSNMGNYWVSVNQTQNAAIKEAISKGILLRW
ncbi:enhanced entry protein EnhB [Legionella sp. W05-934-2]|uniref:enhanced entry protein EnhB n=1 Tax=Legionella sp. W05-934-2 TaxID=1198649 RepID=UPI003463255A